MIDHTTPEYQITLRAGPVMAPPPGQLPLVTSADLFQQGKTLIIDHGGQLYLLRVTRENRLILTK